MKKIIFVFFMMFSFGVNAKRDDLLSITLDKQFYFSNIADNEFEVAVRNTGTGLAYVDVQMYSGSLSRNTGSNDELVFDLNQKLLKYDLYPSTVLVPPHQEKLIKVVRTAPYGAADNEEFYRLRVIPISPAELLKNNPALWDKLNAEQKMELHSELKNTQGVFNFSIGAGSILTVQPRKNIDFKSISLLSEISGLSLKNTGRYTVELSSLVLYSIRNEPVHFDKVILKPGDIKGIKYTNKRGALTQFTPVRISYVNQFGDKIDIML